MTKNEKEMYLILMGWSYETPILASGVNRFRKPMETWWFPSDGSPILKKYTVTRCVDYAFGWQKAVDDGTVFIK